MDTRTPLKRSEIMAAVHSTNTKPEIAVRKLLFAAGYRFRLHYRTLPGKPDIVLPSKRKIVLVHGCFWHGHGCPKGRLPKSRLEFWKPKIEKNRQRDARTLRALRKLGWRVVVVWQCELRYTRRLWHKLSVFLENKNRKASHTGRREQRRSTHCH